MNLQQKLSVTFSKGDTLHEFHSIGNSSVSGTKYAELVQEVSGGFDLIQRCGITSNGSLMVLENLSETSITIKESDGLGTEELGKVNPGEIIVLRITSSVHADPDSGTALIRTLFIEE